MITSKGSQHLLLTAACLMLPLLGSLAGGHCVDEVERHGGALAECAALQVGQPLRGALCTGANVHQQRVFSLENEVAYQSLVTIPRADGSH